MRCFHRTTGENAAAIIRDGFRDSTGCSRCRLLQPVYGPAMPDDAACWPRATTLAAGDPLWASCGFWQGAVAGGVYRARRKSERIVDKQELAR